MEVYCFLIERERKREREGEEMKQFNMLNKFCAAYLSATAAAVARPHALSPEVEIIRIGGTSKIFRLMKTKQRRGSSLCGLFTMKI
jgi:ribulose kinase